MWSCPLCPAPRPWPGAAAGAQHCAGGLHRSPSPPWWKRRCADAPPEATCQQHMSSSPEADSGPPHVTSILACHRLDFFEYEIDIDRPKFSAWRALSPSGPFISLTDIVTGGTFLSQILELHCPVWATHCHLWLPQFKVIKNELTISSSSALTHSGRSAATRCWGQPVSVNHRRPWAVLLWTLPSVAGTSCPGSWQSLLERPG